MRLENYELQNSWFNNLPLIIKKHYLITCSISCSSQQGVLQTLRWPYRLVFSRDALVSVSAIVWKRRRLAWSPAGSQHEAIFTAFWLLTISLGQNWSLILSSPLNILGLVYRSSEHLLRLQQMTTLGTTPHEDFPPSRSPLENLLARTFGSNYN